jgi:hypothetical protein
MLPRLLAHWHPGGAEDRVEEGFDWGTDELGSPAPRRPPRPSSFWNDPFATQPPRMPPQAQEADASERETGGEAPEGETVVVFYRVDDGESLSSIASRFGIRPSRVVADNRLDPGAKLQKGMLLKLHVPRSALSRLASERPFDESQYAPPVQVETGSGPDDAPTVAAPAPPVAPERIQREDIDPFAPRAAPPSPRTKRPHGGRSSGRRSMADFPELFARKP